jgi:hypothetical protein
VHDTTELANRAIRQMISMWAKVDPLQAPGVSNPGDLKQFSIQGDEVEDPMEKNVLRLRFPDVVSMADRAQGKVKVKYMDSLKYASTPGGVYVDLYHVIDRRLVPDGVDPDEPDVEERTYKLVAKRLKRPILRDSVDREVSLMMVS